MQNQLEDKFERIEQLEQENRLLADNYSQQKDLTAELQMSLLKKHTEVNNYLQFTVLLVSKLVQDKTDLLDTDKKIEIGKHVVEVIGLIIGTTKMNNLDSTQNGLLYWAEQYLLESKTEIEKKNFEGASYLCRQAIEMVQQITIDTSTHREQENTQEIIFLSPMPMKLLKKSNFRTAPSIKAKVNKILEVGSLVNALGYKGNWVHVSLANQVNAVGWIHYSLLY